jgi:hypothetical protein
MFVFTNAFRLTWSPIQCVQEVLVPGKKNGNGDPNNFHLMQKVKNEWNCTFSPPYGFMTSAAIVFGFTD